MIDVLWYCDTCCVLWHIPRVVTCSTCGNVYHVWWHVPRVVTCTTCGDMYHVWWHVPRVVTCTTCCNTYYVLLHATVKLYKFQSNNTWHTCLHTQTSTSWGAGGMWTALRPSTDSYRSELALNSLTLDTAPLEGRTVVIVLLSVVFRETIFLRIILPFKHDWYLFWFFDDFPNLKKPPALFLFSSGAIDPMLSADTFRPSLRR